MHICFYVQNASSCKTHKLVTVITPRKEITGWLGDRTTDFTWLPFH